MSRCASSRSGSCPDTADLAPAVEQRVFTRDDRTDRLLKVIGPEGGDVVKVHQDASVHVASLEPGDGGGASHRRRPRRVRLPDRRRRNLRRQGGGDRRRRQGHRSTAADHPRRPAERADPGRRADAFEAVGIWRGSESKVDPNQVGRRPARASVAISRHSARVTAASASRTSATAEAAIDRLVTPRPTRTHASAGDGGSLAADADRLAGRATGLGRHPDQVQQRRLPRVEQVRQLAGHPVRRQRVLARGRWCRCSGSRRARGGRQRAAPRPGSRPSRRRSADRAGGRGRRIPSSRRPWRPSAP